MFRSITTDNGREFAAFADFENLGTGICFAHLYSAWERPVNERTNCIFRKFIPKGCSIHDYAIDTLPRKRLHYQNPEELFDVIYALNLCDTLLQLSVQLVITIVGKVK